MSRLYNYFLSYWQINPADDESKRATLANAVTKGFITQDESDTIISGNETGSA